MDYDTILIQSLATHGEVEVKFLNIDLKGTEQKLVYMGATGFAEKLFRSISFDYPRFPPDKESVLVRLRGEGDKVTLTYKKRLKKLLKTSDLILSEKKICSSPRCIRCLA